MSSQSHFTDLAVVSFASEVLVLLICISCTQSVSVTKLVIFSSNKFFTNVPILNGLSVTHLAFVLEFHCFIYYYHLRSLKTWCLLIFLFLKVDLDRPIKMAVKRTLPQPSNPNKKAKVEVAVSVEELKESFANKSEKSGTVVLGRKTFDLALLGSMADILLEELPSFEFAKDDGEEASAAYSIVFTQQFSEEQMRLLVDKLELNGAACVLYGEKPVRIQGLILWMLAIKLRSQYLYLRIPQSELEQTSTEKRAFNGKTEVTKLEELNCLIKQRRKHWATQAILKTKRICTKHQSYPNFFVFETAYTTLLQGWSGKKLSHDNVYNKILLYIEIGNQYLLKKKVPEGKTE